MTKSDETKNIKIVTTLLFKEKAFPKTNKYKKKILDEKRSVEGCANFSLIFLISFNIMINDLR